MSLANAKRVLGRTVAVAGLAVVVAAGLGTSGALAEKSANTFQMPPSWNSCTRLTNDYLEDLYEAVHHPEPGVDYDVLLALDKEQMDLRCNQIAVELN